MRENTLFTTHRFFGDSGSMKEAYTVLGILGFCHRRFCAKDLLDRNFLLHPSYIYYLTDICNLFSN